VEVNRPDRGVRHRKGKNRDDLPERHHGVTLDPVLTDSDGLPAPQVTYRTSEGTRRILDLAIPKKPEARGTRPHERSIGVFGHGEASMIDDAPAILKAQAANHHSYGDFGAPFIIAIGTYIFDTDRWHSTNAMYGRVGVQLTESASGELLTCEVRHPDGYLGTPPGWRNSNVSGVLLVNQLMPYHVQRTEVTLWRPPLAAHPLPEDVGLPGESIVFQRGALEAIKSPVKADDFFGLPDPWPPGEPWPNG
jgi:hypothetical protein